MPPRQPYNGNKRRLVIAFDLGTTYSGASYAVLDPGKIPTVQTVLRYPDFEATDATIPTIIYYDRSGRVLSVGAEPELGEIEDLDNEDILKVEWFKLLLRSQSASTAPGIPSPKLPASKTVVDVYADFYRYLYECAQSYIKETLVGNMGNLIWNSLNGDIDFVLSHPNGWEGAQQDAMRRAAVKAGLVPQKDAHSRITFVTEGEASMHFCVSNGQYADEFKAGDSIMIIDAGGGTVDLSSYTFASTTPIEIMEIAAPDCIFEGSVIVRQRAEDHIRVKLRNSKFGDEGYISAMANEFDKTAKKRFKGSPGSVLIRFSSLVETDVKVGVRNGRLTLVGDEMRGFFDPSVSAILDAVERQNREASSQAFISTFFLVGGFAASEYLFQRLQTHLEEQDVRLYRPATSAAKAVAEGAVLFFVDRYVSTRVARYTYGTRVSIPARSLTVGERLSRSDSTFTALNGKLYVAGAFTSILHLGNQVSEVKEFRKSLTIDRYPWRNTCETAIVAYRGSHPPRFIDQEEDAFATLCTIRASLSQVPEATISGKDGPYSESLVDVVLSFGLTEFKAELAWISEDGEEKRSPASVIYESDFVAVNVPDSY